jgi:hypothetical protein
VETPAQRTARSPQQTLVHDQPVFDAVDSNEACPPRVAFVRHLRSILQAGGTLRP